MSSEKTDTKYSKLNELATHLYKILNDVSAKIYKMDEVKTDRIYYHTIIPDNDEYINVVLDYSLDGTINVAMNRNIRISTSTDDGHIVMIGSILSLYYKKEKLLECDLYADEIYFSFFDNPNINDNDKKTTINISFTKENFSEENLFNYVLMYSKFDPVLKLDIFVKLIKAIWDSYFYKVELVSDDSYIL